MSDDSMQRVKLAILSLFLYFNVVASISNAAPLKMPSEQEIQANFEAFARSYNCQGTQYSLMEAASRKLPCLDGKRTIPIVYGNLKNGEWDRKEVLSIAKGEYELFQPDIENLVNIGSKESDVVVIEYTDPQCPFCINFLQNQFRSIKERFIDTGKVQYKIHHTPLPFHKDAFLATEANYCANDQGAYSAYRQLLMTDANKQTNDDLIEYARNMKLDEERFTTCLDNHDHAEQVRREKSILDKVMPITFPFFIIGRYVNGKFSAHSIYGAPYFQVLDTEKIANWIEKELVAS